MIELYREQTSPEADWVEAELKDMVLGYALHIITPAEMPEALKTATLPVLRDGEKMASGRDDLMTYLKELEKFAEEWRLFQSDSCYIREDRRNC